MRPHRPKQIVRQKVRKMAIDVVIDTNVLMHAHDSRQPCQNDCIELIELMLSCETHICLDEGYDWCESKNRSKIMSEYKNYIYHGTLGHALLITLAQNQRIKMVSSKVNSSTSKIIQKNVMDITDRCFVKVAANSNDRTLISHDYAAINKERRLSIKSEISVHIIDAKFGKNFLVGDKG